MVVRIVDTLYVRICHNNVWQELKVQESASEALWELQNKDTQLNALRPGSWSHNSMHSGVKLIPMTVYSSAIYIVQSHV